MPAFLTLAKRISATLLIILEDKELKIAMWLIGFIFQIEYELLVYLCTVDNFPHFRSSIID